ncbi:MAG: pyridoxamine 5'-phosphate oxidase family protein [Rudaea sp.]
MSAQPGKKQKRRLPAKRPGVLTGSVRRFLRRPRVARLATISPDGYPHIVPLYFLRDGETLVFGSDCDERKVWNARRNGKGAVVIGGEPETDEAGYLIQGTLSVEEDPERRVLRRLARRYGSGTDSEDESDEWGQAGSVIIRLTPRRVIRVW